MKIRPEDKRLICCELDLNQLFPLRYQWAWDMYLEANENHWLPTEIGMADDVAQWRNGLPPEIKHLFLTNLAMLTTFDVIRGRDLSEAIVGKIDAPECKIFLARQAYDEANHTHSYQYCIENLGIDTHEIYNRYRTVPEMAAKARLAQYWSSQAQHADLNTYIGKQQFLLALVFGFIGFEHGWFPMGFSIGHALSRIGLMKRTAEQFQYIQRDELHHSNFGVKLINAFIEENQDVWTEATRAEIKRVLEDIVVTEEAYIAYALPRPILGYSAYDHITQIKHRLNLRAAEIGIMGLFPNTQNVMPWLDEMVNVKKEVNFFEQKVKEYRKTGLSWE